MEPALAKDTEARGGHGLSSLTLDCYSCNDRRALPMGCNRVTRRADRRGERRPHVLFWRPWIHNSCRQETPKSLPYAPGLCEIPQAGQRPAEYNHPVRLFWPKSKSLDHMYVEADDLLRNFPVQATISFYNDSDSDTDNDEDNTEEQHDSGFESE